MSTKSVEMLESNEKKNKVFPHFAAPSPLVFPPAVPCEEAWPSIAKLALQLLSFNEMYKQLQKVEPRAGAPCFGSCFTTTAFKCQAFAAPTWRAH